MNKILSTPRRLVLALVAAGAIGALGATGAGLVGVVHSDARAATSLFAPAGQPASPVSPAGAVVAPNFADITARNGAAVVNISVVGSSRAMGDDGDEAAARQEQGQGQGLQGMDPNDPSLNSSAASACPACRAWASPSRSAMCPCAARARASSSPATA